MTKALVYKDISFSASDTSEEFDCSTYTLVGIIVPASPGFTSIAFEGSATRGGTFTGIYDEFAVEKSVTITNDSTSRTYDLTDIFPACLRYGKLKASASNSQTITIILKEI